MLHGRRDFSLDGEVLHNLQHPGADSFSPVTSATEAIRVPDLAQLD